jgi:hypothetical protein
LRVRRGDRVRLRYVNRTGPADIQLDAGQPTNLHYHGMTIPPREPADYIYLMIPPKGGMPLGHIGHMPAAPSSRVRTDPASGLSYYDYDWGCRRSTRKARTGTIRTRTASSRTSCSAAWPGC